MIYDANTPLIPNFRAYCAVLKRALGHDLTQIQCEAARLEYGTLSVERLIQKLECWGLLQDRKNAELAQSLDEEFENKSALTE